MVIEDDELEKSDAIIVLSGNEERLEHAAELYHEGYADKVILSNSTAPSVNVKNAESLGIPHAVIIEETEATSTFENALFSKELMKSNNLDSAIIVTSNYHTRRTKLTFDTIFDPNKYKLIYSTTISEFRDNKREIKTTFNEYLKLSVYWLRLIFY
ncbi:YdcF family protein [Thalassobacillus sp. CUG 92003]|uniref:YdcF family protein n=1 Tax=Thalassobacillus sp. CUG 92003 TaxID=2736641 RepID=UPI0015E654AA|nr:YdcF family protein [Thalassobacillus sp. CUG 92003]